MLQVYMVAHQLQEMDKVRMGQTFVVKDRNFTSAALVMNLGSLSSLHVFGSQCQLA